MPVESQLDPLVGSLLEGRFQVERLLGEGGMGRVYVADDLRLRRRCALKVLLPEFLADRECVERFVHEAQALAQIRHEHVIEVYHLGDDANCGVVFFAMELLIGKDLQARLLERHRKPLTWQQISAWMQQVASAMAAVHTAGMIHRDLKPGNIFLTQRRDGGERVKLLDFGIAKIADSSVTRTGVTLGTPTYMSPEYMLAHELDARADIYSLGVVFFEALAGRLPFEGEPLEVAMQRCKIAPPRIAEVAPEAGVPGELDEFVQRMLSMEREARPQTMQEIERFLQNLLAADAVRVPVVAPTANVSPSSSRVPATSLPKDSRPRRPTPTPSRSRWRLPVAVFAGAGALALALVCVFVNYGDAPVVPQAPAVPPETRAERSEPIPITDAPQPPIPAANTPQPLSPPDNTAISQPVLPSMSKAPEEAPKSRTPGGTPADPLAKIKRAAHVCRRKHDAAHGPKITIDYAIGSNGSVTRAVPTQPDALGQCLAEAVKMTTFAPQLKLGLKIDL